MKIRKTALVAVVILGFVAAVFRAVVLPLSVVDLTIGSFVALAFAELLLIEAA